MNKNKLCLKVAIYLEYIFYLLFIINESTVQNYSASVDTQVSSTSEYYVCGIEFFTIARRNYRERCEMLELLIFL